MRESISNALSVLVVVAMSLSAGVLGAIVYLHRQPSTAPAPHIVVVDMRHLIEPVMTNASLDDASRRRRAAEIGKSMGVAMDRYAASGAIVLDASAVLRAPKEFYVEP